MRQVCEAFRLQTKIHSPLPRQSILTMIGHIGLLSRKKDKARSMHKEDVREREHFRLDIMVSIGVSRMKKTGVVIVEPGAKVNSKYYCEHFLSRSFLPVIQATCGRHNWTVDIRAYRPTSGRSSISHSQRYN